MPVKIFLGNIPYLVMVPFTLNNIALKMDCLILDAIMFECAGRTKLEPIAIIILSVIMALASCQMILQGGTRIVQFIIYDMNHVDAVNLTEVVCVSISNMSAYVVPEGPSGPEFLTDSIVICAVTIG